MAQTEPIYSGTHPNHLGIVRGSNPVGAWSKVPLTPLSTDGTVKAFAEGETLATAAIVKNKSGVSMTIGPNAEGDIETLANGDSYMIPFAGKAVDLSQWNFVAVAGKGPTIFFVPA